MMDRDSVLHRSLGIGAETHRGDTLGTAPAQAVKIRVLGDYAVIHARTSYRKPDGTEGAGWYTDDWQLRPEGWRCVSAHVSRS